MVLLLISMYLCVDLVCAVMGVAVSVVLIHTFLSCTLLSLFIFFFFKQKTAYEMRISDWSSDVCSSDLVYKWAPSMAVSIFHRVTGDGLAIVGALMFLW